MPRGMPPRMKKNSTSADFKLSSVLVWIAVKVRVREFSSTVAMATIAWPAQLIAAPRPVSCRSSVQDVCSRWSSSRRNYGQLWHKDWRSSSILHVKIKVRAASVTAHTHVEKKGIVITGGSKGLGFSLAREFLAANEKVVICGRNEEQLSAAVASLQTEFGSSSVHGVRCDVSSAADVAVLASFAVENLGTVHFWINNAGEVTSKKLLADVDAAEIVRVSGTNVLGSLLCCREAIRLMRLQDTSSKPIYHIFNMGFSRWGASFTKSACTHKSTKVALTQLTRSLSEELQAAGLSSIGVHNLSPGMVLTDLLLKDSTPVARRFFNTLAEEPETVAKDLVPRILATRGTGQSIECLSPASAFFKVATGFPQIISGGRFFDKDGNRVRVTGSRYQDNGVKLI